MVHFLFLRSSGYSQRDRPQNVQDRNRISRAPIFSAWRPSFEARRTCSKTETMIDNVITKKCRFGGSDLKTTLRLTRLFSASQIFPDTSCRAISSIEHNSLMWRRCQFRTFT